MTEEKPKQDPYYIGKITKKDADKKKDAELKGKKHNYYLVKFQYKTDNEYDKILAKGYVPTAVYLTYEWTQNKSDIPITDPTEIDITETKGFDDKELVNLVSNNTMYLPNNQTSFIVVFERTAKTPATYKPIAICITDQDPEFDIMVHINKYKYTPSSPEFTLLTDKYHDNSVHYKQYEPPIDIKFGVSGNGGTIGGKRTRPRYSRKRIKQYRKKSRVRKVGKPTVSSFTGQSP